jgi:hypothetical protein
MNPPVPAWVRISLALAGFYHVTVGILIVLFPLAPFDWLQLRHPEHVAILQCLGTIFGVHGIGFLIAAGDPVRFWPLLLVGLLVKLLAPAAFILAIVRAELPVATSWFVLANDAIWWLPLAGSLAFALRAERLAASPPLAGAAHPPLSPSLERVQRILQTLAAPAPTQERLFPDLERRLGELDQSYRDGLETLARERAVDERQLASLRRAGDRLARLAERTLGEHAPAPRDPDEWGTMRATARLALAQFGWSIDVPLREISSN